jgi:hypothetical protein
MRGRPQANFGIAKLVSNDLDFHCAAPGSIERRGFAFALLRLSMRISQCRFNAGRACTRLLDCDKSC